MADRLALQTLGLPEREALKKAISHPVKNKVIAALAERPDVTIRQMAERLGEPPRRIRHQVEALVAKGLVEVTGEERRRGVIERRYALVGTLDFEDTEWLTPEVRVRFAKEIVKLLLADIGVAAAAGTFGVHPDRAEVRFYGEVDDACLAELAELHMKAYREINEAITAGRERVWESGAPGTEVVSGLFFFESPLWGRQAEKS